MQYFSIVLSQVIGFVVFVIIGIICVKTRIFGPRGLGLFSRFITHVSLPLLLFTNTLNGADRQQFIAALPIIFITAVFYLVLYVVCRLLAAVFQLKGNERQVYRACAMFGNVGFMGIPIIAAVFPKQGMLYIALFTVVDQLLLWTLGVDLTAPVDKLNAMSPLERLKKMVNPATVAIVLAVIGIFIGVKLPESVDQALTRAGGITTPLAMIYMGGLFCYIDIPQYVKSIEFYGTVVLKMCLLPLVFYYGLLYCGVLQDIATTMALLASLPAMASVVMLAQNQKSAGNYAAGMTLVTTACSVVTIPLVCLFLR